MANPLFITIVIVAAILVYLQNRKKYQSHFYENLPTNQLYAELVGLINSILEYQNETSKFTFSGFEDHSDLLEKMANLKNELKAHNPNAVFELKEYFNINGNFKQLADLNNWKIEYNKLYERFFLIFETLEKREF
ncbi:MULTISPECIES: hypothetical protein [Winogradskyella]|uniref:Uncharacterized protein n=1 Tax=Winogradskyella marincola TaxID=3037795 RepID=A0ABT6FX19_9FLAO|nr:hypothetical protein [Winogradskyella sp. YYF002]MDG4714336.1 hypothetical protein [Winogradskyella sp. YYF002]